ncbi:MAG: aminotransferase class V-fold PLP-dependent enzyme [Oscillospiraceae bacterium]|nr:aminotransferase class V-fold PLP-dependent enzyme [Oscillospiraceae bacterium]
MIYLDSAATSLHKPPQVAEAVAEAIRSLGNPARGGHPVSLAADRTVYETRRRLAAFLGCPRPDHVIFTSNATEALNIALFGLLGPGERAVSTDLEHNSVLRPLYALERQGLELAFVPADRQGRVDEADFERLLTPGTRTVVCTHASNLTGNALDLARIAELTHARGALLIVDAAQTAGVLPLDMTAMGIDVLCFTGHKGLLGPQGTGGLCIRPGLELRPFKRGGSGVHSYDPEQPAAYPTRLEAGTLNAHGLAGLNAALAYFSVVGRESLYAREHARMEAFYQGVRDIPGVTVYGDFSRPLRAGIVSLNLGDADSAAVADALATDFGIAVRAGAHCAPRMHRALGTEEQGAVRFSFSPFTTPQEVQAAVEAVKTLAAE